MDNIDKVWVVTASYNFNGDITNSVLKVYKNEKTAQDYCTNKLLLLALVGALLTVQVNTDKAKIWTGEGLGIAMTQMTLNTD